MDNGARQMNYEMVQMNEALVRGDNIVSIELRTTELVVTDTNGKEHVFSAKTRGEEAAELDTKLEEILMVMHRALNRPVAFNAQQFRELKDAFKDVGKFLPPGRR